jgi:hypothetical protein
VQTRRTNYESYLDWLIDEKKSSYKAYAIRTLFGGKKKNKWIYRVKTGL